MQGKPLWVLFGLCLLLGCSEKDNRARLIAYSIQDGTKLWDLRPDAESIGYPFHSVLGQIDTIGVKVCNPADEVYLAYDSMTGEGETPREFIANAVSADDTIAFTRSIVEETADDVGENMQVFDSTTGDLIWTDQVADSTFLTMQHEMILGIVQSWSLEATSVTAWDRNTGEQKWTVTLDGFSGPSGLYEIIPDRYSSNEFTTVYDEVNGIVVLANDTGEQAWAMEPSAANKPVVTSGAVVFEPLDAGEPTDTLEAVDIQDGQTIWSKEFPELRYIEYEGDGLGVYVTALDLGQLQDPDQPEGAVLIALDPQTGETLWEVSSNSFANEENKLPEFIMTETHVVFWDTEELVGVARAGGSEAWRSSVPKVGDDASRKMETDHANVYVFWNGKSIRDCASTYEE